MPKHGDVFTFPDGTRWLLELPAHESPDGAVHFVIDAPPGMFPPPLHIHPNATDCYEVLEGEISLKLHGSWRTLAAGERLEVPPGTSHTVDNRSGTPARVRNIHRPACGFDEFVAHADRLMREREIRGTKDPRVPLLFSHLTLHYPHALAPADHATKPLARIARLLGLGI